MLKISDILKKAKRQEKAAEKAAADTAKRSLRPEAGANPPAEKIEVRQQMVPPVPGEPVKIQRQASPDPAVREIYEQGIVLARRAMDPAEKNADFVLKTIRQNIEALIDSLLQDENQLLRLFLGEYFTEQGYIYQHSVNVAILCARLGIALHYSRARLQQLSLAAFLHDIGLAGYADIISQPRRLNEAEYAEVKKHPLAAKEHLKYHMQEIDSVILEVVGQEHERLDGSGYPYNLSGQDINEYAKIIGLADVYEAVLHKRPYREKMSCLEAVKHLLAIKSAFEYKFLKTLLDTVGVFPVMTMIKLSTRESGIVIQQNSQMPLRPVIEITHNTQGQTISEPKQLNLAANFSVYIQDCFGETSSKR